jgi:hypothetical protein
MATHDPIAMVIDVVRGIQPLGNLSQAGISVQLTEPGGASDYTRKWSFNAPNSLMITAKSTDVAQGLLNVVHNRDYAQQWAGFMIAAPFISFAFDEERDPVSLTDLLWDMSSGSFPSNRELDQVKAIVEEKQNGLVSK